MPQATRKPRRSQRPARRISRKAFKVIDALGGWLLVGFLVYAIVYFATELALWIGE